MAISHYVQYKIRLSLPCIRDKAVTQYENLLVDKV